MWAAKPKKAKKKNSKRVRFWDDYFQEGIEIESEGDSTHQMKQIQPSAIRRKERIIDVDHGVSNQTLNNGPDAMIQNIKNVSGVDTKVIESKDGCSPPS